MNQGVGRQTVYVSLPGSRSVGDPDGANVTQILLNGAKYRLRIKAFICRHSGESTRMPNSQQSLTSDRPTGGKTRRVTPEDVAERRE